VSQSGPTKIAFNYNLPIIASNLPGFSDEILEGVNGYLFEPGNVEDLVCVMAHAIDTYNCGYDKLNDRTYQTILFSGKNSLSIYRNVQLRIM